MVEIANLNGHSVWVNKRLNEKFIYTVKWKKFLLYVWTEDDLYLAKIIADLSVDTITTDRVHLIKNGFSTNSQ